MNRLKNILWILLPFFLFVILYVMDLKYKCPWKMIFKIPCPGCGMTRAFRLIFQGRIIDSFNYNIMALPLAIVVFISMVFLLIDLIKNQTLYMDKIDKMVQKHIILILTLITVVWLFNIILNSKRL